MSPHRARRGQRQPRAEWAVAFACVIAFTGTGASAPPDAVRLIRAHGRHLRREEAILAADAILEDRPYGQK